MASTPGCENDGKMGRPVAMGSLFTSRTKRIYQSIPCPYRRPQPGSPIVPEVW